VQLDLYTPIKLSVLSVYQSTNKSIYIKFCSLFVLSSEVHVALTQISAELLTNLSVEQAWPKLCETCRSHLQCSTIERDSHVTCTRSFERVLIWMSVGKRIASYL
jgi:hypothetical protein